VVAGKYVIIQWPPTVAAVGQGTSWHVRAALLNSSLFQVHIYRLANKCSAYCSKDADQQRA
jgi:hypothetical protein